MNFDDTKEEAAFRSEVRAWLRSNAPQDLHEALLKSSAETASSVELPRLEGVDPVAASKAWQKKKYEAGWACLRWPVRYGGRESRPIEEVIWQQEEGVYSHLSDLFAVGQGIVGPTLLAHGSEEQKDRLLRPIASGEEVWCQLFSEPAGGSDLAGLLTRAEHVNNSWVVSGQKIWTTHAQIADFGLLLARTDTSVPKHAGLSMFIVDMKAEGITVSPIKQMTGECTFNEVSLSNVRIPEQYKIGEAGQGWKIALTALMNERLRLATAVHTGVPEIIKFCRSTSTSATGIPLIDDPGVRAKIASWIARANGLHYTMMRTVSALSQGRPPGPENSIGKLVAGDIMQDLAVFALDLQGPAGAVFYGDATKDRFQRMLLSSPRIRIGGGTAEIQRNIIGERVLGLPPDSRPDKLRPFSETSTMWSNSGNPSPSK